MKYRIILIGVVIALLISGLMLKARLAYAAEDCECGCGASCTDACSYNTCQYQCGDHNPGDYWCSGDEIKHCSSSPCGQAPCELQQTCDEYNQDTGECISWTPDCCETNSETGECLKYQYACGDYPYTEELLSTTKNCNDYDCDTGLYWKCTSGNVVKKYGDDYTCGSSDDTAIYTVESAGLGCIVSGDKYCGWGGDCDSKDGTTTTVFNVWTCEDESIKKQWGDNYYCTLGDTKSTAYSWSSLCKISNNSSAATGNTCDCSDADGFYVKTTTSTKKIDSYCSGPSGKPTNPETPDATCEQTVVYNFDCSKLNNWYGVDLRILDSEKPGCTDITFYGNIAYRAKGEAVQGDPVYDCENDFVGDKTECQKEYSPKWSGLKIAGCTLIKYTEYENLRTDYEMYGEPGNKIEGDGVDFFNYKYVVDYLGAKTVGNQKNPEDVQEIKYRKDQCMFQQSYTRDTENADNEYIRYGWILDEESAKTPDKYHVDAGEYNAPPDFIREWRCRTYFPYGAYGDFENCEAIMPTTTNSYAFAPKKEIGGISFASLLIDTGITPSEPIDTELPGRQWPITRTSVENNCVALYENGPRGWYKTSDTGTYVWVDIGCYYGRCAAAFYDPDIPTTAFVVAGTPTASFTPKKSEYEYDPIPYQSDPEYVIMRNTLKNDILNRGAMCEKNASYNSTLGPEASWKGGEWYEFDVSSTIRAAIISSGIEGWWISSNRWGHCCGDDDGEQLSSDCDPATEDFDPITCKCVAKGTATTIGTVTEVFRPDCAIVEFNVVPTDLVEGQQVNLVIVAGNLGDTTATSGQLQVNYGDGTSETISIPVLEAKETRRFVLQHIYEDPGNPSVSVQITCPNDNNPANDSASETIKVEEVVKTAPSESEGSKSTSTGIPAIDFIVSVIRGIQNIFFEGAIR